jgi:hypothetical protein
MHGITIFISCSLHGTLEIVRSKVLFSLEPMLQLGPKTLVHARYQWKNMKKIMGVSKKKKVFYFLKCAPNYIGKHRHDNMLSNYAIKKTWKMSFQFMIRFLSCLRVA